MPTRPRIVTLTNSASEVLNAIRNSASINFQNYVPFAQKDGSNIREIGAIIMDNPALQNEYIQALINRIGKVLVTSKLFSNPWAVFKKGILRYGETVEEVFVDLATPFQYDAAVAESEVFKREIPDVRSAFHIMNYKTFYKDTIMKGQLEQSFLSEEGVLDFIGKIVEKMYASAAYDEFLVMKYLLAYHIYKGNMAVTTLPANYTTVTDDVVSLIKGVSNRFEFMSRKFNRAGVANLSAKRDQYLVVSSEFDAAMSVNVLATAFNMSQAEFMGHKILTDGFGELDVDRLNVLFANDSTYHQFTTAELAALNTVPAVLVDRDFFVVLDNKNEFAEIYNGQGLYWNYFYHIWQTYSVSPFANATAFLPASPAVTGVTLSPSTVTLAAGATQVFVATVATTDFAPQSVNWTVTGANSDATTITAGGLLTVGADETASSLTVKATSTYDNTEYGTATVTVS